LRIACRDTLEPRLLASAPELASLALLDDALVICAAALFAEHPTLGHELRPEPASLREARRLLAESDRLARAVARYRRAVLAAIAPNPTDHDHLPF
jgi:hypothetical protein